MTDDSFTKKEMVEYLKGIVCHVLFSYKGKNGCVDPFRRDLYCLCYDGKTTEVHNIDDVMNTPFIDGKSLNEVFDELDYVE